MRKGEQTREAILVHALRLATKVGFEGLTIGRLADDLELSKSGLFAHFKSKENLQVQVLEMASRRFIDEVIKPALGAPRGERRVRALFERWMQWEASPSLPGGCPFMAASTEPDDRPAPGRVDPGGPPACRIWNSWRCKIARPFGRRACRSPRGSCARPLRR